MLVDLIILDFHDFDVILGIDRLATHHGYEACFEKMVNFQPVGMKPFHFRGLRRTDIARLAALSLANPEAGDSSAIPVVCEYLDVFPEELPRLPSDLMIEFAIELMPGTALILRAPYRMAPVELKELKV